MVANGIANKDEEFDESIIPRPPDIEQDMKEMERRKRVKQLIMESQVFKDELERIIESQMNEGYLPSTLSALQQVTELISPKPGGLNVFGHNTTIPINDIRGVDAFKYDKHEKQLRCKLASVYRLVDLYGWSQLIYNHITVRVDQSHEHFLINSFGLQYPEITASSLIKIDLQGNTIDAGSTNFTFNRAGFVLHSSIHAARPDIKAIIHIHYPPCVAISCLKHGLLCICQEAAIIGDVSYHDYKGLAIDTELRDSVARDLGPVNKVLILRNHGVITCGETIEEALYYMYNLVKACETQIKLEPIQPGSLNEMSQAAKDQVRSIVTNFGTAVQGKPESSSDKTTNSSFKSSSNLKKWKIFDLEFESQMRMLDNAGFRTGYIYRQPLLRASTRTNVNSLNDIEIPPAAQNHLVDNLLYENWLTPLKSLINTQQKKEKMNQWINTPNSYQKVELSETGTEDPKKITKWVNSSSVGGDQRDGSGSQQNIKIDSHQFIPLNENGKREFHMKQKKMKEFRRANQMSEGPQSRILEASLNDSIDGVTETRVVVGAASKGIIQKEYQHNARIYKTVYEKNPFDNVNYDELDEYTNSIIGNKTRPKELDESYDSYEVNQPAGDQFVRSQHQSDDRKGNKVQRSHSARMAAQELEDSYFNRKFRSERKPKLKTMSEASLEDQLNDTSLSNDISNSEKSSKKDKKSTFSFLRSSKKKKKEKKEAA